MASETNFLKLVLPANNEFNNTWDQPLNDNLELIDSEIESISNEIRSARFDLPTLSEFLNVAHFSDGTIKPSDEVDAARNSPVYGDDEGGNDYLLGDRLDKGDRELWDAREGESALLGNLARRLADNDYLDSVLEGPEDNDGYPNFLSSSGAEFLLNGTPTPILLNIGGHLMKVEDDISVDVTGADGTKYLVAQRPSSPFVVFDRSTQQAASTTTYALNNDKVQILQHNGVDFTAENIRPGMLLNLLNTDAEGQYIIKEVAPQGNANQLLIIGIFPLPISSINYTVTDPLRPEFSVEDSFSPAKGKCYVGEGEFVSGSLTSDLTYAFKHQFESPYEAVDVSSLPTFEVIFNHNLGRIPRDVQIFASQANDGSEAWEPLSTALVGNDFSVDINNTLSFTPGTFNPGSTDATYTQGSLSGDVTGSLSGSNYALRSVQVKVTKTQIFIKGVRNNHFYRDYDGTDRQTGYLKAVCK